MIGVGIPATTTARGIGRVATLADMEPDAIIENGPAFLAAGDSSVRAWLNSLGDVGDILASLATSKNGYLLCNGGAYSRTTYSALFTLLGTAFGSGDGSTTFNVPDFRGRTIQGANANLMAVIAAGLPNITGEASRGISGDDTGFLNESATPTGAFKKGNVKSYIMAGTLGTGYALAIDVSVSGTNAIYGKSATVQPPAIAANIFIKY